MTLRTTHSLFLAFYLASAARSAGTLDWPVDPAAGEHEIISSYGQYVGYSIIPVHVGIDIPGVPGQAVVAVEDGIVQQFSDRGNGAAQWFAILHDPQDTTRGWGYGHLDAALGHVEPGDTVSAGDTIGRIVAWPTEGFHHVHLACYHNMTGDTMVDSEGSANPLDYLKASGNSTPPSFHASKGQTYYFYDYYTDIELPAGNLSGKVKVAVGVHDSTHNPDWQIGIYSLRYWITEPGGELAFDTCVAARFDFALGGVAQAAALVDEFFDAEKSTRYAGYYLLGDMGEGSFTGSKAAAYVDTRELANGTHVIHVEACDYEGNCAKDSVQITTNNTAGSAITQRHGAEHWAKVALHVFSNGRGGAAPFLKSDDVPLFDLLGRKCVHAVDWE